MAFKMHYDTMARVIIDLENSLLRNIGARVFMSYFNPTILYNIYVVLYKSLFHRRFLTILKGY